ncbi:MAG: glycosyltransferase family 2 protein [Solirubrobacteraceae bacterium]
MDSTLSDSNTASTPAVTFVLPTLNAAGSLFERALQSIRGQDYPQERVEVIVADGGSSDATRATAEGFGARVIGNPNRLAEWGVKEGILVASGEIVVIFAADNELVDGGWLRRVTGRFATDADVAACYGRLVSGSDDPPLNKYQALIQSEPLNWFLNRNLETYLAGRAPGHDGGIAFSVDPARPLVWGANGLALRADWVRSIWGRPGYVADTDAFHELIRSGRDRVVYFPGPYCYHHQVASLSDMRRKWLRNSRDHLLGQGEARDLDWVLVPGFRRRAVLWMIYSLVPVFSVADAVRRAVGDRSPYWLYHPVASLLQALTYVEVVIGTPAGRRFLSRTLIKRPPA